MDHQEGLATSNELDGIEMIYSANVRRGSETETAAFVFVHPSFVRIGQFRNDRIVFLLLFRLCFVLRLGLVGSIMVRPTAFAGTNTIDGRGDSGRLDGCRSIDDGNDGVDSPSGLLKLRRQTENVQIAGRPVRVDVHECHCLGSPVLGVEIGVGLKVYPFVSEGCIVLVVVVVEGVSATRRRRMPSPACSTGGGSSSTSLFRPADDRIQLFRIRIRRIGRRRVLRQLIQRRSHDVVPHGIPQGPPPHPRGRQPPRLFDVGVQRPKRQERTRRARSADQTRETHAPHHAREADAPMEVAEGGSKSRRSDVSRQTGAGVDARVSEEVEDGGVGGDAVEVSGEGGEGDEEGGEPEGAFGGRGAIGVAIGIVRETGVSGSLLETILLETIQTRQELVVRHGRQQIGRRGHAPQNESQGRNDDSRPDDQFVRIGQRGRDELVDLQGPIRNGRAHDPTDGEVNSRGGDDAPKGSAGNGLRGVFQSVGLAHPVQDSRDAGVDQGEGGEDVGRDSREGIGFEARPEVFHGRAIVGLEVAVVDAEGEGDGPGQDADDGEDGDHQKQVGEDDDEAIAEVHAGRRGRDDGEREDLRVVPKQVAGEAVAPAGVVGADGAVDGLHDAQHEHAPAENAARVVQQAQGGAHVGAEGAADDVVRAAALDGAVGHDGRQGGPRQERGGRGREQQRGGADAAGLGRDVGQPEEQDHAQNGLQGGQEGAAEGAQIGMMLGIIFCVVAVAEATRGMIAIAIAMAIAVAVVMTGVMTTGFRFLAMTIRLLLVVVVVAVAVAVAVVVIGIVVVVVAKSSTASKISAVIVIFSKPIAIKILFLRRRKIPRIRILPPRLLQFPPLAAPAADAQQGPVEVGLEIRQEIHVRRPIGQHFHPLLQPLHLRPTGLVGLLHGLQLVLGVALRFGRAAQEGFELGVLFFEGGVFAEEVLEGGDGGLGEGVGEEEGGEFFLEVFVGGWEVAEGWIGCGCGCGSACACCG
mmetsp:Transcript_3898/g.8337  ORF Transcript_3898/g.8337 Transcript_3898/m.8337 type:complete len:978 (-) Transcript_3898:125-3058(-)